MPSEASAPVPLAARLNAQLLPQPARDPVAVAERVLAVQGQDPRGFRLAVRARTRASRPPTWTVRSPRTARSLITWLNRGTLHLVRSEDYPLAPGASPRRRFVTSSARRLAQEGVPPRDAERGIADVERSLADEGPLTSDALRERIAAIGVRAEGQALYHLLFQASLRGLIVRGPMAGTEAGVRARPRLAARARSRWTATRRSASSRAATWWATGPQPTATSRAGRASRCATRASRRSPRPGTAGAHAGSGQSRSFRRRVSSAASSRACSAGPRATDIVGERLAEPRHGRRHVLPVRDGARAGGGEVEAARRRARARAASRASRRPTARRWSATPRTSRRFLG